MKWSEVLPQDILNLSNQLKGRAMRERKAGKIIYPEQENIFKALNITTPDIVKVCLVGQDPYHTPGAANGLAFSISEECPMQPSLKNIFTELCSDIGCPYPSTTDLTKWAKEGVLLLNTSLTVYEHQANSHANWGWQEFTKGVLRAATRLPQPIVFLLWGSNAQGLLDSLLSCAATYEDGRHIVREKLIKKAYILSSHPSPLSVNRTCRGTPAFKKSKPFTITNQLLQEMGAEPIDWSL